MQLTDMLSQPPPPQQQLTVTGKASRCRLHRVAVGSLEGGSRQPGRLTHHTGPVGARVW